MAGFKQQRGYGFAFPCEHKSYLDFSLFSSSLGKSWTPRLELNSLWEGFGLWHRGVSFIKLLAMGISSKNSACATLLKDSLFRKSSCFFFSVDFKIANKYLMLSSVREIIAYMSTHMDFIYIYLSLMLKDLLVFKGPQVTLPPSLLLD